MGISTPELDACCLDGGGGCDGPVSGEADCCFGAVDGDGAAGAAESPMNATTVLMPTVAPSGNLISVRMPATVEGISASTLSVEISKSGSSFSTESPICLSHLVMVPSTIDSPIWGMMTGVGMKSFTPRVGIVGPGSCRIINCGRQA